ncbi:DUF6585 family protein [Nocardia asteroides]|uniref:DUF6585 family protein n=1 Tax=Nocardia asteroides TaxID=1824 RepID=UPI0037CBF16C
MNRGTTQTDAERRLLTEIARLAAEAELGNHNHAYPADRPNQKMMIIVAVIVAVILAVTVAAFLTDKPGIAIIALLCLPVASPVAFQLRHSVRLLRYRGSRLDLYEHGLVVAHAGRVQAVRYASTTALRRQIYPGHNGQAGPIRYEMTDIFGHSVKVSDVYSNTAHWRVEIDRGLIAAQLPAALATIHSGGRVVFGDIWLSATEIGDRKRSAPWSQVTPMTVAMGTMAIGTHGKLRDLVGAETSRIPNFPVFGALVEQLRSTAQPPNQ